MNTTALATALGTVFGTGTSLTSSHKVPFFNGTTPAGLATMSDLASVLGVAQTVNITSVSVIDDLAEGLYGYIGGVDFGIGISAGLIEVASYSGYKVQKVTTFDSGSNLTWTRVWNQSWSNWQRLDNFGCNTLASLASALGAFYNQGVVQDPNLNDYTSTQLVVYGTSGHVQPSQMNTPSGSNGQCFVLGYGGSYCIQIVNDQADGVYIRSKSDIREWSQWTLIAGVS